MRLTIDHRTVYRFTEPQTRLVQMLRMTPQNHYDQTVASWRIDVDYDSRMRDARDGYGNATTMLYVEGPIEQIAITVSGEILTSHSNGVLNGTTEVFPPRLFLRTTPATRADEKISAFARDVQGDATTLGTLHRINGALNDRFGIEDTRPEPGLAATDAFDRGRVTVRDLAQIFVAAARDMGVPARYVSGYRLTADGGLSTPHGWAEAYVDEIGWIGFDPSTGRSPEDDYVRVASALDAVGAAAVAGSRLGEGNEALDVDINVAVVP